MSSVHDGHPQKNCSVGEDVVGFGVGDGVFGEPVGVLVGEDVIGAAVGDFVGSLDGAAVVGEPVGVLVGEGVTGAAVGAFVGSLDGAFVGDDVGEDVTGVDTGADVGEQVKDVSHCVFVVPPPSHVPRLAGLPELGKQSLSLSQELPELVLFAEHVP